MERDKPTGMTRLVRAFGYSFQGFRHAWREEAAFRQEVCLAVLLIPLGLYLGRSGVERAMLVSPMLLILVVEILNSAVEAVVDRSGTERHPLAGMAKDMGSAAVMLSFVLLGTVWFLILSDHGPRSTPILGIAWRVFH
jgi:diacylglycerol kinase (ATP)